MAAIHRFGRFRHSIMLNLRRLLTIVMVAVSLFFIFVPGVNAAEPIHTQFTSLTSELQQAAPFGLMSLQPKTLGVQAPISTSAGTDEISESLPVDDALPIQCVKCIVPGTVCFNKWVIKPASCNGNPATCFNNPMCK
jgi:hypothetical protein